MSRLTLVPVPFRVFLAVTFLVSLACVASAREWTDSTGSFRVKGEVVAFDGKVVRLTLEEGLTVNIPIEKLSDADQAYLKKTYPDGKAAPGGTKGGSAKKGAAKAEVVSIAVVKPIADMPAESTGPYAPGTHVRLYVTDPELSITGLDNEKSKIASFTDNKNTNLLEGESAGQSPLNFEASADGKSGLVTIHVPTIPAEKSVRMTLKGELHLMCGLGEDAETVRVPLNLELTLGL